MQEFFETKINFNLHCCRGFKENYKNTTWANKNNWDMFETTLSKALQFIKLKKTNICNLCQTMNENEYDNDDLNNNQEVYYFTTSYFVTEPDSLM